MTSGERDALRELINCVEKMVLADRTTWIETRSWLDLALQDYKAALSHMGDAPPGYVTLAVYEAAVKGRQDFRQATVKARAGDAALWKAAADLLQWPHTVEDTSGGRGEPRCIFCYAPDLQCDDSCPWMRLHKAARPEQGAEPAQEEKP